MKRIQPEDPRLTDYAVGELTGQESEELRRAEQANPAVQEVVEETRALAELIRAGLSNEDLELGESRREAIRRAGRTSAPGKLAVFHPRRRDWLRPVVVTAAAAILVACVLWVLQQVPVIENGTVWEDEGTEDRNAARMQILLSPRPQPARSIAGHTALPQTLKENLYSKLPEIPAEIVDEEFLALRELWQSDPEAFLTEVQSAAMEARLPELSRIPLLPDNPFVPTREVVRSVVPIVSGSASYHLVERFVRNERQLPPRNSVRIEELINQVSYVDEGDADLNGVKLGVEVVRCPWDPDLILMGVLLRNESSRVVARDTNLQVEMDPEFIKSYRLVGYAGHGLREEGGTASGGLAPGRANYDLYQLQPADPDTAASHHVVAKVGLHTGEAGHGLVVPVTAPAREWSLASNNLQTAVALGSWGMVLRQSPFGGTLAHQHIRELAEDALTGSEKPDLKRREALQLVLDSLPLFEIEPEAGER